MLGLIIGLPVALLLAVFALSNPQPVQVALWPTAYVWETSLAAAVLIPAAIAFLAGAILAGTSQLGLRARARRAEAEARRLAARSSGTPALGAGPSR
jgi:uncharacterized integral membrane protein